MIYYLPFIDLNKLTIYFLKKYELKKTKVSKSSLRQCKAKYKRNDITMPYAILRNIAQT